ncbi:MAG: hypothetical protein IMW91_10140 [Firmicutes bacterium]|nr:hypothetical protein [Bacillota bacterium]
MASARKTSNQNLIPPWLPMLWRLAVVVALILGLLLLFGVLPSGAAIQGIHMLFGIVLLGSIWYACARTLGRPPGTFLLVAAILTLVGAILGGIFQGNGGPWMNVLHPLLMVAAVALAEMAMTRRAR